MAKQDEIKSTKDIIDEKLKDKKLDHGPQGYYEKIADAWTTGIKTKVERLEEAMTGTFYDIRRELRKNGGFLKEDSFKDITDKIYNAGLDVYKRLVGIEATEKYGEESFETGKEKLKRMIDRELPFDVEGIQKALKKSYKKTGELNKDLLQQQLTYAFRGFERSLKGDIQEKLSKKIMESPEEIKACKKYIEYLANSVNEKLEEDDLMGIEAMMNRLLELAEKRKMMQGM